VRRREFIAGLGAAVWPMVARAQQAGSMPRIGYVTAASEGDVDAQARADAFRDGLRKLGWIDGRNLRIDYRWGVTGSDGWQPVAQLIASTPNVVLAHTSPITEALKRETKSIPIVFVSVADPLSSGLVQSLARPEANLTGFTNYEFGTGEKWLQLLMEVAPTIKRVLILFNPSNIGHEGLARAIEMMAVKLDVQTPTLSNQLDTFEIERSIDAFAQGPHRGLIVVPNDRAQEARDLIVRLAARHRLPAVYGQFPFVVSGGLMSYSTDDIDIFRRAASYVARILHGETPGDLPVQNPTKYKLAINLKTATALGLTLPLGLLVSADEVIE
jgi:putative tryptophan/tyrosine transport system substrate-binding protein